MNLKFWKREHSESEDFFDMDARERMIAKNLETARIAKSGISEYWKRMRAYYDGDHDTQRQTQAMLSDMNLPFRLCSVPDGFLHVEGQIEALAPDFEFSARNEREEAISKLREKVVRHVVDENDMVAKNAINERRLNLYGSAVWKLSVSENASGKVDISIENPSPETIFPDPFAASLDDCEYVAFIYRINAARAARIFAKDLSERGISMETLSHGKRSGKRDPLGLGETVEVTEYWFRQAADGEYGEGLHTEIYKSGDVALSILIEGKEVRYLPKFWTNTSNTSYPFVIYNKIPTEGSLWGRSELEQITSLIDAADRQLTFAQLNTAFFANDILLYEENAFSSDSFPENRPGAIWKLRPGMMEKVKRLGGLCSDHIAHYDIVEKYRSMMKEALGNYDFMQGDSSTQVTTATGLALLGDYAAKRVKAKNICKKAGFERLYRLIDALSMEIFSAERLHEITDCDEPFCYADCEEKFGYLPMPAISVYVGNGVEHSKAFTLSALSDLCGAEITETNYPIIRAYIAALGIPERASLTDAMDRIFAEKGERKNERNGDEIRTDGSTLG